MELAVAAKIGHDPEKPLAEGWVTMSNALTRAAHGLNLSEKRLMAACVAQIDALHPGGRLKDGIVRLSAADYAALYEVSLDAAYSELKAAADNLFERYIRVVCETPKGQKETKFRWVESATYHHGEGWVELRFTHAVKPHLVKIQGQYATYKLKQASALRSGYSWRLLELFALQVDKNNRKTFKGWLAISIEDFQHAMDVPASFRKNYKDLRRRVIEPAVKELIGKDGLLVSWEEKRQGRKVVSLRFEFQKADQQQLPL